MKSAIITVRIIVLCLLAQLTLSWPLWYAGAGRTFPELPIAGLNFPISPPFEILQIGIVLLLAVLSGVFPLVKWYQAGLVAGLLWLIARDMNRLQPWVYFYLLTLGLLLSAGSNTLAGKKRVQWLLAAVYVWGGFNKITPYFALDNFPWFCEAFVWTKPFGAHPEAGYAVAVGELLLGPGLLWQKSRKVFRWLAIGFHVFIAVALSRFGLDWNTVVIPWNFAMAGMVWALFDPAERSEPTGGRQRGTAGTVAAGGLLALAWVMPALNIFHLWDEALSWKMYSNTQTEASFFSNTGAPCARYAAIWRQLAYDNGTKILFDDWAMADIHVPAYNSRRAHQQLARYICACRETTNGTTGLFLLSVNRWDRAAERETTIPCSSWPH